MEKIFVSLLTVVAVKSFLVCILVRRKRKVHFDMLVGLTADPEAKAADLYLDNQYRKKTVLSVLLNLWMWNFALT